MSNIHQLKASFRIYIDYARERSEMEDIHKLRVTIRKLKVLYAVIEFSLPDKFTKIGYSVAFKDLFSSAGRVRETQINSLVIQKFGIKYLEPYVDYQTRALKRNSRNFKKSVEEFELEKFEGQCELILNLLSRFDDKWCLDKIFAYSSSKIEKIAVLKVARSNDQVLHKIRKQIRSISDALSMVKKDARKQASVPLFEIRQVNDKLGRWHDEVVLIHSLKSFEKGHADTLKKNRWEAFIHRTEQKMEHDKQLIIEILGDWK